MGFNSAFKALKFTECLVTGEIFYLQFAYKIGINSHKVDVTP